MLERKNILSLEFIRMTPYHGSFEGLRFRLEKTEENGEMRLLAWAWPEPYAFDHTAEEEKKKNSFSFDEAGILDAVDWLNRMHGEMAAELPGR